MFSNTKVERRTQHIPGEVYTDMYHPIDLPHLEFPKQGMDWKLSLPLGFMHVGTWNIEIMRCNLESYLEKPDEFLRDCREAVTFSEQLKSGDCFLQRENRVDSCNYHAMQGYWMPMSLSPWKRKEDSDDYITLYATDPTRDFKQIGIRHYISTEKHEELVKEARLDVLDSIDDRIADGVERGITKALKESTATLKQIEDEKKRLKGELDRLEKMEARVTAREATKAAKQKERTSAGYVYLLSAVHDPTLFKIGRTANPDNRAKTFGVQLPFAVEYVCLIQCDDMYALEAELHAKYAHVRLDGEWFKLGEQEVAYIKSLV